MGAFADRAKVSPHTILYYERRGLLPAARRSSNGYRLFSQESVRQIRFIKRAQALGFSLKEVKAILALTRAAGASCADIHEIVQAKVADIDAKLRSLREARKMLARLSEQCDGGGAARACEILQQLGDE
ncbi:MAG: MerR family transcriptional regulator [Candidatus Binatia bacterium]